MSRNKGLSELYEGKQTFDTKKLLRRHRELMNIARRLHRNAERLDSSDMVLLYQNIENMQSSLDMLKEDGLKDILDFYALRIAVMEGLDYFNEFW